MADAIRRVIGQLIYTPGLQDTTDLEAATKTITVTSEAAGTGNADYSAALTIAAPGDGRVAVKMIATRLSFTIDSFTGATILYCRVYVDAQDANHLLIDTSHNAASNKLATQNTLVGTKEVIFNLLKDGAAHTFYFFFWVNQATNAIISVVRLWEAVGIGGTASWGGTILSLTHTGLAGVGIYYLALGTGTTGLVLLRPASTEPGDGAFFPLNGNLAQSSPSAEAFVGNSSFLLASGCDLIAYGSVTTDLNYVSGITFFLRSD